MSRPLSFFHAVVSWKKYQGPSQTVGHRFIYEDDYRILARITDAGALSQIYRYGTRINTPDAIYSGAWHRIITDHLGSVRLVVRADNGTIAQRIDYNDLGRVTADSSPGFQAYGFAGGIYLSAEGLVKFGARYYDPIVGRWLSKDPILFEGRDSNLYGYVMNDPINFIDPEGTVRRITGPYNYDIPGIGEVEIPDWALPKDKRDVQDAIERYKEPPMCPASQKKSPGPLPRPPIKGAPQGSAPVA